ncbi:MAG TPA: ATP-binding protein [Xanthobacteraceae bacterium]|nr:ATP-binding protein [Xanthobacteraceae bacterium]
MSEFETSAFETSRFETCALATPEAISETVTDVMAFLQREHVDPRATHHVALVIEEMLANLGTHGDCRDTPARITLRVEPARITGEIVDRGPAFDPRIAPPPDLAALPDERKVGGLGLHLVRQLSTLEYSRQGDENHMTFFVVRS